VPCGSAPVDPPGLELPFRALPSPRLVDQPPLLGLANTRRSPAGHLPSAPPPTHPPRVHSRWPEPPSASRRPASKSRSILVVSHHLDGFSPRDGSQVCCTLQPVLGFATFRIVKSVSQLPDRSPRRDHPSKDTTTPTAATRSPAPVPPWRSSSNLTDEIVSDVAGGERGRHLRGLDPWRGSRWRGVLPQRVTVFLPGLFSSSRLRRCRVRAGRPVTRAKNQERPPPLTRVNPGSAGVVPAASVRERAVAGENALPP
jgi:hypothetical protein